MPAMNPYTVIGVASSARCPRVHLCVCAYSPQEAVAQAEGEMNDVGVPGAERLRLLAALVFEGHLDCAHDEHLGNCTRGLERGGRLVPPGPDVPLYPYTVVCVDPATHRVHAMFLLAPAPGNAERNAEFDFFLIGSVLEGQCTPVHLTEGSAARVSTRDERILACAREYSSAYRAYLGTNIRMHARVPRAGH